MARKSNSSLNGGKPKTFIFGGMRYGQEEVRADQEGSSKQG